MVLFVQYPAQGCQSFQLCCVDIAAWQRSSTTEAINKLVALPRRKQEAQLPQR